MRHVIFRWLLAVALAFSLIMPALMYVLVPDAHPFRALSRVQDFVAQQIAAQWQRPQERQQVLQRAAAIFHTRLELQEHGRTIAEAGPGCDGHTWTVPVTRAGQQLGAMTICRPGGHPHLRMLVMILVVMIVLWLVAGRIAARISRPLAQLSHVAGRIGGGDFTARTHKGHHRVMEIRALASTLDDMAQRLERQQEEHRELLAAVSHELRSPLTRMRVALEIAEQRHTDPKLIASLQEEISNADRLVSDMLANARLDFQHLERAPLSLANLAQTALQRRQQQGVQLEIGFTGTVPGDANLLARALDNLLDNATRHGTGPTHIRIYRDSDLVFIDVCDDGPGFAAETLPHVFKSFYRSAQGGVQGLGLGLSLVQRIAQAHGGHAHAENGPHGGACVGIGLPPHQRN